MLKRWIIGTLLAFCCVLNATALTPFDPETSLCNEETLGETAIEEGYAELEAIWIPIKISCEAGTYLEKDSIECSLCKENHYCPGTTDSIISSIEDQGIVACESGFSTAGAKTFAECCPEGTDWNEEKNRCVSRVYVCESGKWLHIGDGENDKICLMTTKPEGVPSLAISYDGNTVYYMPLSTDTNMPMHENSTKKFHVEYNGHTYNAHDDSVE